MIVTKAQLIGDLYIKLTGQPRIAELTKKDLELVVDTYIGMLESQLIKRNGFRLGHIGTAKIVTRKGRMIKLPKSDREVEIPDTDKISIIQSKGFSQALRVTQ